MTRSNIEKTKSRMLSLGKAYKGLMNMNIWLRNLQIGMNLRLPLIDSITAAYFGAIRQCCFETNASEQRITSLGSTVFEYVAR